LGILECLCFGILTFVNFSDITIDKAPLLDMYIVDVEADPHTDLYYQELERLHSEHLE